MNNMDVTPQTTAGQPSPPRAPMGRVTQVIVLDLRFILFWSLRPSVPSGANVAAGDVNVDAINNGADIVQNDTPFGASGDGGDSDEEVEEADVHIFPRTADSCPRA
eukprot:scaffold8284_cov88-Skeletonema_dohrnii-CCMP3373.AAC.1